MDKLIAAEILKTIAADNDMDFYFNPKNFPDQKFVTDFYTTFDLGRDLSLHFERLDFFNILWKQYHFVVENIDYPHKCVSHFQTLPLNLTQKRIVLATILKLINDKSICKVDISKTTILLLWREFFKYFHISDGNINFEGLDIEFKPVKQSSMGIAKLVIKFCFLNYIQKPFLYVKTIFSIKGKNEIPKTEIKGIEDKIQTPKKQFYQYLLLHKQNTKLALALKSEFSTEKGKSIRYLLEALAHSQPPIITIVEGEKKALYNSIKEYFNRDIGSYNSIFQCKFNPDSDPVEKQNLQKFKVRINHILEKL